MLMPVENTKFEMPVFKVPAVAMQRPGVVAQPQQHALVQNGYVGSRFYKKLKSARITWNHAGADVAVVGSWDNWKSRQVVTIYAFKFQMWSVLAFAT